MSPSHWHCHCCTKKNDPQATKCITCGRPDTYANRAYLPLHDIGKRVLRANQVATLLPGDAIHDVSESTNWTALHSTAAVGNYELVRELVANGSVVEARTLHGHTPLHLAAYSGSLECCSCLVAAKANVNAQTFSEKNTALHIAVGEGWGSIVEYLVGVRADVHVKNAVGRTALHVAASVGRHDIGMCLLQNKSDPGALDSLGWSPRQVAEFHRYDEFTELMIRAEMKEVQYSMKDVPPGKWDTGLWRDAVSSYHQSKAQIEKERSRFDKKIRRTSTSTFTINSQYSDTSTCTPTSGEENRQKKAKEGISALAMAAKRNIEIK